MSTFIGSSKGGVVVQLEDLRFIPTPEPTYSWKPVSHHNMVEVLKSELHSHGLAITSENYSVAAGGLNLFGVFNVIGDHDPEIGMPAAFSIGFRHSNKKQFAIQMVAGLNVFVCSNLCFSGDMITLKRKHTSGLNLRWELANGVDRYLVKSAALEDEINFMRARDVTPLEAKAFLVDNVVNGNLPQALLKTAYENYFEHDDNKPDCADRTAWGLHNAVTRAIRDANLVPESKFGITIKLGSIIRKLLNH